MLFIVTVASNGGAALGPGVVSSVSLGMCKHQVLIGIYGWYAQLARFVVLRWFYTIPSYLSALEGYSANVYLNSTIGQSRACILGKLVPEKAGIL